ncbi:MAG: type II secretion system F family protein [Candidatus Thermoplasmatota archaeon]
MAKEEEEKPDDRQGFAQQLRIAYNSLEDKRKFYVTVLTPLIIIGLIVFSLPIVLNILLPVKLNLNPITFVVGGVVPISIGILYPYIEWKNKETDIDSKMHFFITHLRVLSISDLSLQDIIKMIGGKKVYGSLGEEFKKISVLTDKWRMPTSKAFRFVSERTPSKILTDFLDRFSQSLDSGVEHREFVETEQDAVLQEYKTMYESSNENIVILNEVYVSLLIAIIFVMSMGIVLPIIMGTENMNMFIYMSSFMLIVAEGLLLYLLKAMIPADDIWHQTGEKGEVEKKINRFFKISISGCIFTVSIIYFSYFVLEIGFIRSLPIEIIVAVAVTPLFAVGGVTFIEEQKINRKESSYLGFLPALGSISAMRGGKINDSVYYLSKKKYGVLSRHIRNLYRRLRTRIDDDAAWEWFGIDTGSNYVQRGSEMFREATFAAGNPRSVSQMISENLRKIRDLRIKKLTIVNTSIALFAGITFGISFAIYVSLIIGEHLNGIVRDMGNPFANTEGMGGLEMGQLLHSIPPSMYYGNFLIIFAVLVIHCLMLSLTLKVIRGSHKYLVFLYFVPFVWIVAITSVVVQIFIGGIIT